MIMVRALRRDFSRYNRVRTEKTRRSLSCCSGVAQKASCVYAPQQRCRGSGPVARSPMFRCDF